MYNGILQRIFFVKVNAEPKRFQLSDEEADLLIREAAEQEKATIEIVEYLNKETQTPLHADLA